jgi:hypothetical protein
MSIDRYTKAVLTVIAGALVYIAAMLGGTHAAAQGPSPAQAQAPSQAERPGDAGKPQPVVVVGWGSMRDDGVVQLQRVRDATGMMRTDLTLPVALQVTSERPVPVAIARQPVAVSLNATPQRPLPVALTAIRPATQDWDQIRVRIDPQPATPRPGLP